MGGMEGGVVSTIWGEYGQVINIQRLNVYGENGGVVVHNIREERERDGTQQSMGGNEEVRERDGTQQNMGGIWEREERQPHLFGEEVLLQFGAI